MQKPKRPRGTIKCSGGPFACGVTLEDDYGNKQKCRCGPIKVFIWSGFVLMVLSIIAMFALVAWSKM